jgi:hypothetical protein
MVPLDDRTVGVDTATAGYGNPSSAPSDRRYSRRSDDDEAQAPPTKMVSTGQATRAYELLRNVFA